MIQGKYGTTKTIFFPLIDAGAADFEATPVTHASGDTEISKDGGAFANTTNAFVHEGNGIYSLVLTATEMEAAQIVVTIVDQGTKAFEDQAVLLETYGHASAEHETLPADVTKINDNAAAAAALSASVRSMLTGAVNDANTTPTTSLFASPDITETTADHFIGRLLLFYDSGDALYGQVCEIVDYAWDSGNSEGVFTVSALTEAPADGAKFVIV